MPESNATRTTPPAADDGEATTVTQRTAIRNSPFLIRYSYRRLVADQAPCHTGIRADRAPGTQWPVIR